MVKRARFWLATTTLALACASGACVVVLGMDPLSEKTAGGGTLDADAPDSDGALPGACEVDNIGEIGRPPFTAPTQGDGGAVHFAMTLLDLGIDPNAPRPGLNIDRRVTTDEATSGCLPTDGGARNIVDSHGGVDNTTFGLVQQLSTLYAAFKPETINQRLTLGYFGVVVRVDGWNGAPNDEDVVVLVFPTIGYWRTLPDGGTAWERHVGVPFDADAGHVWMPDARFREGTIGSKIRSAEGWVNEGRLVARFDRFTLPLRSSVDELKSFDIELRDVWLTARIAADSGQLLEGNLAGRVPAGAFIEQVAFLRTGQSAHLCGAALLGAADLCAARDVRSSYCDDGKGLACDALSFGARFEAERADGLGPFRARTDDEFLDAGQVPPSERCPELRDAAALDCR